MGDRVRSLEPTEKHRLRDPGFSTSQNFELALGLRLRVSEFGLMFGVRD